MTRSILLLTCLAIIVLIPGCARDESAVAGTETGTGTFQRPEPQPGELGTDALTQTVELTDGRSENEGGVIVTPDPQVRVGASPVPPAQTNTATTTTQKAAPPSPPREQ